MPNDVSLYNLDDPQVRKLLCKWISGLDGLYWIEIRRCKDQRSLAQSAFFHGVWLPRITKRMSELWGETVYAEAAKEFLKDRFLRVPVLNVVTKEVQGHRVKGTHELDKDEMSVFLNEVDRFAKEELDLILPSARKFRPKPLDEPEIMV